MLSANLLTQIGIYYSMRTIPAARRFRLFGLLPLGCDRALSHRRQAHCRSRFRRDSKVWPWVTKKSPPWPHHLFSYLRGIACHQVQSSTHPTRSSHESMSPIHLPSTPSPMSMDTGRSTPEDGNVSCPVGAKFTRLFLLVLTLAFD